MTNDTPTTKHSVLRLRSVMDRTGLARSTIYERMRDGSFPRQFTLGERCVGWLASDIDAWIESRVDASRATARLESS
ncbi:MAG: AlpA family transcriptional regulator [Burkholderiales bacterium]